MSDAAALVLITVVLIGLAVATRLRLLGRCGSCGNWGQLHKGACVDCLGELVEGLTDERKRSQKKSEAGDRIF